MLILRFTIKAFKKFSQTPRLVEVDSQDQDLGEWYVNTIDWVNQGELIMAVMHAKSLYAMLLPIEKGMQIDSFIHSVYAAILIRMLRLEIPREKAENILSLYGDSAILAKSNSRSLTASLSTVIKDLEVLLEYPHKSTKDGSNILDLARIESNLNETPRTMNKKYIWPLRAFYNSINRLCPGLPARMPLPLELYSQKASVELCRLFDTYLSDGLAIKAKASMFGGEVLFSVEEIDSIMSAVKDAEKDCFNIDPKILAKFKRNLSVKISQLKENHNNL